MNKKHCGFMSTFTILLFNANILCDIQDESSLWFLDLFSSFDSSAYHLSFLHGMQGRMRREAWVKHALGAWHSSTFIKIRLAFVDAARAASDLRAGNKHYRTDVDHEDTISSFTRCNPFVFPVPRGLALCARCIFLMYINVLYCSLRLHLCIL